MIMWAWNSVFPQTLRPRWVEGVLLVLPPRYKLIRQYSCRLALLPRLSTPQYHYCTQLPSQSLPTQTRPSNNYSNSPRVPGLTVPPPVSLLHYDMMNLKLEETKELSSVRSQTISKMGDRRTAYKSDSGGGERPMDLALFRGRRPGSN